MFNKLIYIFICSFLCFVFPQSVKAQKNKKQELDTTVQTDGFRTINWLADSFSKAITEKKSNGLLSLFPQFGTFLRYSNKIAPNISSATSSTRYIFYKSKLIKRHKKLRKQMKREGLSFNKAEVQLVKADSGMTKDSISFCKIRVHYKRRKTKYLVECYGIKINDQWFLLDGFTLARTDVEWEED